MNYPKQIITQAVNGKGLSNICQSIYHKKIAKLAVLKSNVSNSYDEAEALRDSIIANKAEIEGTPSDGTAMLKMATVSLPEKMNGFLRAKQDYVAFRAFHNITREPVMPDRLLGFLSFCLMVFVEAGINTPFIMSANLTAGVTSSILLAVLISFTNVFVSALFGYLGRWKNVGIDARDPTEFTTIRIKAHLAFWGYVLVIVWFLLLVGMVRTQGTVDGLEHNLSDYIEVFLTPESLFLVITGACMSIVSYLKAMSAFDDIYPELGEKYRLIQERQEEVLEDWRADYSDIQEQSDEAIDDKKEALKAQQKEISQHSEQVNAYHRNKRQLEEAIVTEKSQFQAQIYEMENEYNAVALGEDYSLSEAETHQLTNFEQLLADMPVPTPLNKPKGLQEAIQQLEGNKQLILSQYDQLLDDIFKPYQGEQS